MNTRDFAGSEGLQQAWNASIRAQTHASSCEDLNGMAEMVSHIIEAAEQLDLRKAGTMMVGMAKLWTSKVEKLRLDSMKVVSKIFDSFREKIQAPRKSQHSQLPSPGTPVGTPLESNATFERSSEISTPSLEQLLPPSFPGARNKRRWEQGNALDLKMTSGLASAALTPEPAQEEVQMPLSDQYSLIDTTKGSQSANMMQQVKLPSLYPFDFNERMRRDVRERNGTTESLIESARRIDLYPRDGEELEMSEEILSPLVSVSQRQTDLFDLAAPTAKPTEDFSIQQIAQGEIVTSMAHTPTLNDRAIRPGPDQHAPRRNSASLSLSPDLTSMGDEEILPDSNDLLTTTQNSSRLPPAKRTRLSRPRRDIHTTISRETITHNMERFEELLVEWAEQRKQARQTGAIRRPLAPAKLFGLKYIPAEIYGEAESMLYLPRDPSDLSEEEENVQVFRGNNTQATSIEQLHDVEDSVGQEMAAESSITLSIEDFLGVSSAEAFQQPAESSALARPMTAAEMLAYDDDLRVDVGEDESGVDALNESNLAAERLFGRLLDLSDRGKIPIPFDALIDDGSDNAGEVRTFALVLYLAQTQRVKTTQDYESDDIIILVHAAP